ncbi:hypothetical protein CR51_31830 [Caballeronia megalochromosomata]|nr:hypothetical protein CR51_31830 [Caballeronia megalochromosomata]
MSKLGALREPVTYVLVGLLNTGIATGLIFLALACGLSPVGANGLGYAAGLLISFLLNSRFTFRVQVGRINMIRFFIVAGVAYLANLLVLLVTTFFIYSGYLAQLPGIVVYTVIGYFANKFWALRG